MHIRLHVQRSGPRKRSFVRFSLSLFFQTLRSIGGPSGTGPQRHPVRRHGLRLFGPSLSPYYIPAETASEKLLASKEVGGVNVLLVVLSTRYVVGFVLSFYEFSRLNRCRIKEII